MTTPAQALLAKEHFKAYDCSTPKGLVSYEANIEPSCDDLSRQIRVQEFAAKNVTIDLLQLTRDEVMPGFTCLHLLTRAAWHCGMWSHSSNVVPLMADEDPIEMSTDDCRNIVKGELFQDKKAQSKTARKVNHKLLVPGETRVKIVQAGSGSASGKCTGGTYWDPYDKKKEYKGVVVIETHIFKIKSTESLLVKQKDGRMKFGEQNLQCDALHRGCSIPPYVVVWRLGTGEQCPARFIRTVNGTVYSLPSGDIFLGNKDAPIALRKKSTRWICDTVVYTTNFAELAFAEHRAYDYNRSRPLRASELRAEYISRISYAYHALGQEVRSTLNEMERARCKQQEGPYDRLLRPLDVLGEETWRVNSVFFRQVAETIYSFQCREVIVRAVDAPVCTTDLKVELLAEYSSSMLARSAQLYMRPGTRMLVTKSVPESCVTAMSRKFKALSGSWVASTPHVVNVESPLPLPRLDTLISDIGMKDVGGPEGIYTEEQQRQLMQTLEGSNTADLVALRWLSSMTGIPGTGGTFLESGRIFQVLTEQLTPSVFWRFITGVYWLLGQLGAFVCGVYVVSWTLMALKNIVTRISSFRELRRDETSTVFHGILWVLSPTLLRVYRDGFAGHAALRERAVRGAARLRRRQNQAAEGPVPAPRRRDLWRNWRQRLPGTGGPHRYEVPRTLSEEEQEPTSPLGESYVAPGLRRQASRWPEERRSRPGEGPECLRLRQIDGHDSCRSRPSLHDLAGPAPAAPDRPYSDPELTLQAGPGEEELEEVYTAGRGTLVPPSERSTDSLSSSDLEEGAGAQLGARTKDNQ